MEKIIQCHFQCQDYHRLGQSYPILFHLSFKFEVFHSLGNHKEHLLLHTGVNLNGIDSTENCPVAQMQENTYEFGILFASDDLEESVQCFLLKGKVNFLFDSLASPIDGENCFRKLQIKSLQEIAYI